MKSEANDLYRLNMLALVSVVLALGTLFTACKPATQDVVAPAENTSVETAPVTVTPVVVPDKPAAEAANQAPVAAPTPPPAQPPAPVASATTAAAAKAEAVYETEAAGKSDTSALEPILHLPMDDTAERASLRDLSAGKFNPKFRDPSGDSNAKSHSVPGVIGKALAFDGKDDHIVLPIGQVDGAFAEKKDFTVAFWWRSDSQKFPDGYREVLRTHSKENGGIALFQRGMNKGKDKRIYMNFYVAGDSNPLLQLPACPPESINEWHHYVFQREGTTVRAWRDGNLLEELKSDGASKNMGSGNVLRINSANAPAQGAFDDFRIYPGALSKPEVIALFEAGGSKEQG